MAMQQRNDAVGLCPTNRIYSRLQRSFKGRLCHHIRLFCGSQWTYQESGGPFGIQCLPLSCFLLTTGCQQEARERQYHSILKLQMICNFNILYQKDRCTLGLEKGSKATRIFKISSTSTIYHNCMLAQRASSFHCLCHALWYLITCQLASIGKATILSE